MPPTEADALLCDALLWMLKAGGVFIAALFIVAAIARHFLGGDEP